MIYEYTLVDTSYTIRFGVRTSERDDRYIVHRLYRTRRGPADRDDLPEQTKGSITKSSKSYRLSPTFPQFAFGVNILQACRQTNAEAASIFYGSNMFGVESAPHLYAFLTHFQRRLPLVKRLGMSRMHPITPKDSVLMNPVSSLPKELVWKGLRHVFPLLVRAENLEALYFHVLVLQSLSSMPVSAANELFDFGFWKMATLAKTKADDSAVLGILKLPAVSDKALMWPKWSKDQTGQDAFMNELARLLKG
jgi:hypothetical protein